jgi:glycosyltransferase involved in cell wall biosynthesis/GT2 family glycosyltransferase
MNAPPIQESGKTARTPLAKGNKAVRQGNFEQAIAHYAQVIVQQPGLAKIISVNLAIARQKYRASRQASPKASVAVCGWELAHNAAGRVYTLASIYETFAQVEIIGSLFPSFGREIWEPIRDTAIAKHTFVVEDESKFIEQAIQLVAVHPYDIIHLSKPRAPNIFFGILYKLLWGAKVLMDIDDEELAFVGAETPLSIDDYIQQHGKLPDLKDLAGKDWTRLAVGLAKEFDGLTVCNAALQQRYGGEIIRHARDEKRFKPSPELKRQSREKYGIPQDAKVVLFFGTPREHKGLIETAQAIASLKHPNLIYCIVGSFSDESLKQRLLAVKGCNYKFLPNQPISKTPEILAIADCCVLLQDTNSTAAQYQTPAKLSDALGMGVFIFASPSSGLDEYIETGVVHEASTANIGQLVSVLFSKGLNGNVVSAARSIFLDRLSLTACSINLKQLSEKGFKANNIAIGKMAENIFHFGSILIAHPGKLVDSEFSRIGHHQSRLSHPAQLVRINQRFKKGKRNPSLFGNLDRIDMSGTLYGWAAMKDSLDKLEVAVVADDGESFITEARTLRGDLAAAKVNDGRHGFEVSIPLHLCDGGEHAFELFDANTGSFILERKFVIHRKPVDLYELRILLEHSGVLLLAYDFYRKCDVLGPARALKSKIEGDLTVIVIEYALPGWAPTRRYSEPGISITALQCSPGLSEGEVFYTILKARVLSGFTSVMMASAGDDGEIALESDAKQLIQNPSGSSIGLAARSMERKRLGPMAMEVLQDWCAQLGYDLDKNSGGLQCKGLVFIDPAVLSEMGALNLESSLKKYESLAHEDAFTDLAFAFMEILARRGGLRVTTHAESKTVPHLSIKIEGCDPRFIAFYLPQYHPIPENDRWWGRGFTEWRNVIRAIPFFDGHNQPRVPADLGFYDLRVGAVQHEQARIAQAHGLYGFCYYYYWFDGIRLLNSPIDSLMRPGAPDFNFCICWANENWTRNWDGHNKHILLQQNYSFESNRRFIRELIPILADPRYIRYAGRPLLIVYRILHMENWTQTAQMWREECRAFGLGEIHLAAVRTNFDTLSDDPAEYGLDSFVLFPPHEVKNVSARQKVKNLQPDFTGQLFDYEDVVTGDIEKYGQWKGGVIHRGAMMAWDNSARRLQHARVYTGATPMKFRSWLKGILKQESTRPEASPYIFINAWNEWAEGTYLEPDSRHGYAYLEALRSLSNQAGCPSITLKDAVIGDRLPRHLQLDEVAPGKPLPDLRRRLSSFVVSHCDYRQGLLAHTESKQTVMVCAHYVGKEVFGGERSLLNVLQGLAVNKYDVVTILPSFENEAYLREICRLSRSVFHVPYRQWQHSRATDEQFVLDVSDILVTESVDLLYANTIVLHEPIVAAKRLSVPIVVHVRELIDRDEALCQQIGLPANEIQRRVEAVADGIIANSDATFRLFSCARNIHLVKNCITPASEVAAVVSVERLRFGMISSNIPKKGLDDLIRVAQSAHERKLPVDFVNVGPINGYVKKKLSESAVPPNLNFVGYRDGAAAALAELDVLLSLSSFAESFGRTVAEALSYGKPVIGYRYGALDELVVEGQGGFLVPYRNTEAVLEKIKFFLDNKNLIATFGSAGKAHIETNYSQGRLNSQLGEALAKVFGSVGKKIVPGGQYGKRNDQHFARPVTVVVPIFNGYQFVKRCIESLMAHVPARTASVILIDDGSTEQAIKVYLKEIIKTTGYRLITNPKNLGYTPTINIGMREAGEDDIVLLNSDAEVTNRWLAGLRVAAYSSADIGTVTAMSDNAGAFSFPKQGEKNNLPSKIQRDLVLTYLLQRTAEHQPVEVPTGSGFCMYIKRALISAIGYFDEIAFPRGYGEENDYCMRARSKGWRNVISPWSYVYHERTVSFGKEKDVLVKEGLARVMGRYPEYGHLAQEAFSSKEIVELRSKIDLIFNKYS